MCVCVEKRLTTAGWCHILVDSHKPPPSVFLFVFPPHTHLNKALCTVMDGIVVFFVYLVFFCGGFTDLEANDPST